MRCGAEDGLSEGGVIDRRIQSFGGCRLAYDSLILTGMRISPRSVLNEPEWSTARQRMVTEQLEQRGITDPLVLQAMLEVPRHLFVPGHYQSQSYEDHPIPIGHGQTISQPYIVAHMSQALGLRGDETVLEVGTGSGYQAAVLSRLARRVYTIEIIESLAMNAQSVFRRLDYDTIAVRVGDGHEGWAEASPFDAILVACAPNEIPYPLTEQLREGGRLAIPLGSGEDQTLYILRKDRGELVQETTMPVRFVPMTRRR